MTAYEHENAVLRERLRASLDREQAAIGRERALRRENAHLKRRNNAWAALARRVRMPRVCGAQEGVQA